MEKGAVFISGATAGIGQATARRLATAGYPLVLSGRREERLQALKKELSPLTDVTTVVLDVRDGAQITSLFAQAPSWFSQVDVLVNNAGLALGTEKLQDGHIQDWDAMIDTNVKGLLALTRQFLPTFIQRRRGHVINLGSVAGHHVYPGGAVYCATKFAVRAINDALRMDVAGSGVRVTMISPGMVETEFSQVRMQSATKAKAVYQGMQPLVGEDIAEAIVWSLERPAHVNVQELVIYPTDQAAVGQVYRRNL